jgi:hypothetical protein
MSKAIHLCALPDDILRAIAKFVPMSGLIVLVRSSRTIAVVLKDQLAQRLDDLLVVIHSEIQCMHPFFNELPTQPRQQELETLFGEASVSTLELSSHNFMEAREGCDGPRNYFKLYRLPAGYADRRYKVASSRNNGQIRFLTWLQPARTTASC